jgi:hypothetical protein
MSTKAAITTLIVLLLLLGAGAYLILRDGGEPNPITPNPTENGGTTNEDLPQEPAQNSMIRVTSPLPNASVRSPLTITGEARGGWYFEASFPVKILDANGKVLGQHYAEAQGEWMTNNFVPFRSTLTFSTPTTETGTLVLEKDNPSGLPENAAEIRIPIRFSDVAAGQTRVVKIYKYDESKDKDASGNILCSAKGLVAVDRTIPLTNTPIQDAVKKLISEETSLPGVTLTSASLNSGVLTLTFSDPQNKTGGGSCRVSVLRAQIEATAKQFAGVNSVRIMPNTVFQP